MGKHNASKIWESDREGFFVVLGKVPTKSNKYRIGKGNFYRDESISLYEKDFAKQVTSKYKNRFKNKDRLIVMVDWYTTNFRQDIDAPLKILLDCMQKNQIIINDNRIDYLNIVRYIDRKNPRVEVGVYAENK